MEDPWYRKGVRFACTGCGKCCTGAPGYVWVNDEEIDAIAAFLNISRDRFTKTYVRKVHQKYSLIERQNHDCIFLKDKKCQIYGARPTQCKTFPYWPEHLRSEATWEALKYSCEGIHNEALDVSFEEIEEQRLIQIKRNKNH